MLHYLHQPVANCVCPLPDAKQVVYSGFITENSCLLHLVVTLRRAADVNQKVVWVRNSKQ